MALDDVFRFEAMAQPILLMGWGAALVAWGRIGPFLRPRTCRLVRPKIE